MRTYPLRFATIALAAIAVHFTVIFFVHAPIKAEYWVRELLIVKRDLVAHMPSPRIIFLGGSSALFNVDARRMSDALHMPVMNFGLHAGLTLERILDEGAAAAKPGDLIVLTLEQSYYKHPDEPWTGWQLRNALAWDRPYFNALPLMRKLQTAFDSSDPHFSFEIAGAWIRSRLSPDGFRERLDALARDADILARYRSGRLRTATFTYSAYNLDAYGTMQGNLGAHFSGAPISVTEPGRILDSVEDRLHLFVSEMKEKRVRVLIAYVPYLVGRDVTAGWEDADVSFRRDASATGAELIGKRDNAFYPRELFFNSALHLNEEGRRRYTDTLIGDLRALATPRQ